MKYFSIIFLFLVLINFSACSLINKGNLYKTSEDVTYKYYPLTPLVTPEKIVIIKE